MSTIEAAQYLESAGSKTPQELIAWAVGEFGPENIVQATSLGAEDQVITDMLVKNGAPVDIFTLDTGRLPQETYAVLEETRERYGRNIGIVFPDAGAVESMVNKGGPNLFYKSTENRKLCCQIRKVEPLKKKLAGIRAWICGLRRDQSPTRTGLQAVEWDAQFSVFKISPIADWNESRVWEYIHQNGVPFNILHGQGYPSIGCACCTRAVQPGEDARAGRWWWEAPEHKECGLHPGK